MNAKSGKRKIDKSILLFFSLNIRDISSFDINICVGLHISN